MGSTAHSTLFHGTICRRVCGWAFFHADYRVSFTRRNGLWDWLISAELTRFVFLLGFVLGNSVSWEGGSIQLEATVCSGKICSQVSSSRIGCRLGLCLVAFMVHDFFSTLSLDRYTVRAAYFNATGSHVVKKESRGEKKRKKRGNGKRGTERG